MDSNLATRVRSVEPCPYLLRNAEGFYCRAVNWGFLAKMPEYGALFRPLTSNEVFFCLKEFKNCPDFKKALFYERKSKGEA
jgi:hypothetical protein